MTIGARYELGRWTPLYAVRHGDTARSEASSTRFWEYFGVHALDGSVYLRSGPAWKKVTYFRPKTRTEIEQFLAERSSFTHETPASLPEPFCHLADEHEERIDYLVAYLSGGTKAYLKAGTTREQAQAINGAVRDRAGLPET